VPGKRSSAKPLAAEPPSRPGPAAACVGPSADGQRAPGSEWRGNGHGVGTYPTRRRGVSLSFHRGKERGRVSISDWRHPKSTPDPFAFRLRPPPRPHRHQPGPRRPAQGRRRLRPAHRPRPARRHRPAPARAAPRQWPGAGILASPDAAGRDRMSGDDTSPWRAMLCRNRAAPRMVGLLREAIQNSGRSLNQLSEASGVPRRQLSRFVRGKRTFTLPVVERVCRALHLTLMPERQQEEEGGARQAAPIVERRPEHARRS
jgi:hypothetical protein